MNGKPSLDELKKQLRRYQSHGADVAGFAAEAEDARGAEPAGEPLAGLWPVAKEVISTGCRELDAWFPQGGMTRGNTIEIVGDHLAAGATHFALALAQRICQAGGICQAGEVRQAQASKPPGLFVIIDRRGDFYPAMLLALGFRLEDVLIVHPQTEEDHLWALEQALADRSVAAVWTRIGKLDKRYQRRWQLAAERGKTIGLLQRPLKVLGHPTWAAAQIEFRVDPNSWLLAGASTTGTHTLPPTRSDLSFGSENWIVQLTARRGIGRFEQADLRLELHNRHVWDEPNAVADRCDGHSVSSKAERSATGVEPRTVGVVASDEPDAAKDYIPAPMLTYRPPRPTDPWFTKATKSNEVAVSESDRSGAQEQRRPG
jgi:hypothetical protein